MSTSWPSGKIIYISYNGHVSDWANKINKGFYFLASNYNTLSMFDTWYAARNESVGLHEQDILKQLIKEGRDPTVGSRVRFLNTLYFGGRDYGKLETMHANCCLTVGAKSSDLSVAQ